MNVERVTTPARKLTVLTAQIAARLLRWMVRCSSLIQTEDEWWKIINLLNVQLACVCTECFPLSTLRCHPQELLCQKCVYKAYWVLWGRSVQRCHSNRLQHPAPAAFLCYHDNFSLKFQIICDFCMLIKSPWIQGDLKKIQKKRKTKINPPISTF